MERLFGKQSLGRRRKRWESGIKIHLREIGCNTVNRFKSHAGANISVLSSCTPFIN